MRPVDAGVYTPTLVNSANLDDSTAYECQWVRIGNVVHVSGKVDIDPTAGAPTLTILRISLPFASDFSAAEQCSGVAFTPGVSGQGAAILADTTNNNASMQWQAVDTSNRGMYFTFTYRIL